MQLLNSSHLIHLENEEIKVAILDFGARIQRLEVKNREGAFVDVVLGYDTLEAYEQDDAYFGALVGRCAGRIGDGTFTLDGKRYVLAVNNPPNHLHGGIQGFSFKRFVVKEQTKDHVTLCYESKDGEEGYPGNVTLSITYTIKGSALQLDYEAVSDQKTLINLTNHSYLNLHGAGNGEVNHHVLCINASTYYPNNEKFLPDHPEPVSGNFDFREGKQLQEVFAQVSKDAQLTQANGIDHYFRFLPEEPVRITLYGPATGIQVCVESDQPGVQVYTPHYTEKYGKDRKNYAGRAAVAIEVQKRSDSIHDECEVLLIPGEVYQQHCTYTFSCQKEDKK